VQHRRLPLPSSMLTREMAIELNLHEIARALGGNVSGNSIRCPGPGHSAKDRSLSLTLTPTAPGGFLVKSFAGDDWRDCKGLVTTRLGFNPFKAKTIKPKPQQSNSRRPTTSVGKGKGAATPRTKEATSDGEFVSPIPRDAPKPPKRHYQLGEPTNK